MYRLRKFITAECLAVAVFLAVGFGLWWGMQTQPERVITFATEYPCNQGTVSPDGTLYWVIERNEDALSRLVGVPPTKANPPAWLERLRVFDLTTEQEVWRWESGQTVVEAITWTKKNHLYFGRREVKTRETGVRFSSMRFSGYVWEILGFDPRPGKGRVFAYRCPERCDSPHMLFSADGNTSAIGQGIDFSTYQTDLADLRTGEVKQLGHTFFGRENCYPWAFSPDSTWLLSTRHESRIKSKPQLHDAKSAKLLHRLEIMNHGLDSTDFVFSPDNRWVAVCDQSGYASDAVYVWDLRSGQLLATLGGFYRHLSNPDAFCVRFVGVGQLRFLQEGSVLGIDTGVVELDCRRSPQRTISYPAECSQVHLFSTQTFQRLQVMERSAFPELGQGPRFEVFWRYATNRKKAYGVFDRHTTANSNLFEPGQDELLEAIVLTNGADNGDLFCVTRQKPATLHPWLQKTREWLRLKKENERLSELTVHDTLDGPPLDRLTFTTLHTELVPCPQSNHLLLHSWIGKNHERLELYAFPAPRPWFPILGGAFVAGMSVELLGLLRRWRASRHLDDVPPARTSA